MINNYLKLVVHSMDFIGACSNGYYRGSFLFVRIYFTRISRLKFAKFNNEPEGEILKRI